MRGTVSVPETDRHTLQTTSALAKGEASETMTLMEKTFRKRQAFRSGMDDAHRAERQLQHLYPHTHTLKNSYNDKRHQTPSASTAQFSVDTVSL